MEDTRALGWTEGQSHTEAAHEYMQAEKSAHDVTRYTPKTHLHEMSSNITSMSISRLKGFPQKTREKCEEEKMAFKVRRRRGPQAEAVISVQVTLGIGRGGISEDFSGVDVSGARQQATRGFWRWRFFFGLVTTAAHPLPSCLLNIVLTS